MISFIRTHFHDVNVDFEPWNMDLVHYVVHYLHV
jgi:hypothetical protein